MRTYWRQRNDLVRSAARHIQRIQKTLTQMNMQLANVLSDVSGVTGQAIIKAILAGERDPQKLAAFRDPRVKASEKDIAQSLEGNWQEDLLFVLKQEQAAFEFCRKQMAECDRQLEQYLQKMEDRSQGATLPEEKRKDRLQKKKKGNQPQFDLQQQLFRMTGTDLTQIDGIDVMTATTILSEAGWDMIKWKDEDHFVSWLRLAPDNRISGDRIIGKGRLPTSNRVTVALKLAASNLRTSQSYLGAQFRRLRARLDTPVAIKAMAAKLARLIYRMLRGRECPALIGKLRASHHALYSERRAPPPVRPWMEHAENWQPCGTLALRIWRFLFGSARPTSGEKDFLYFSLEYGSGFGTFSAWLWQFADIAIRSGISGQRATGIAFQC
jgi:transposase